MCNSVRKRKHEAAPLSFRLPGETMKKSHRLRSAAAAFLAAITVFTSLPHGAQAATSTSQIKDEITDLKRLKNAYIK